MNLPTIIPAILSDQLEVYEKFAETYSAFTDRIHLDIMDGEFVLAKSPNVFEILQTIDNEHVAKYIHLMLKNPINVINILGESGNNIKVVYVHVEAIDEDAYARLLSLELPFQIGFVFDPRTDFDIYADFLTKTKIIQIMTVDPGTQGADFIPATLDKIDILRNKFDYKGEIHIDGHVNVVTLPSILQYGPNILNVGSAIQKAQDPKKAFDLLNEIINPTGE